MYVLHCSNFFGARLENPKINKRSRGGGGPNNNAEGREGGAFIRDLRVYLCKCKYNFGIFFIISIQSILQFLLISHLPSQPRPLSFPMLMISLKKHHKEQENFGIFLCHSICRRFFCEDSLHL